MRFAAARRGVVATMTAVVASLLMTLVHPGSAVAQGIVVEVHGYVTGDQGVRMVPDARVEFVVVEENGTLGRVVASTRTGTGAGMQGNYRLSWTADPSVPVVMRTVDPSGRYMTIYGGSSTTPPTTGERFTRSSSSLSLQTMPSGGRYVPVDPVRVLDTRLDGEGPVGAGDSVHLPLSEMRYPDGRQLVMNPTAVVLNVTATELQCASSFISAGPAAAPDLPRPTTSVLNARAGADVANLVTARVQGIGSTWLYNDSCPVHLVVDLQGYYAYDRGAGFVPTVPHRVLDTRVEAAPLSGGEYRTVDLAARTSVPEGAVAVAVNLTATRATARTSYVSAFAAGDVFGADSSVLNAYAGQDIANVAIVPLADDGSIELYNDAGSTHLVLDIAGWYTADGGVSFFAMDHRRTSSDRAPPLGPEEQRTVSDVAVGIPPDAHALALNLTSTQGTAATSFVTAYPDGIARPFVSNLNSRAGVDLANSAVVRLGPGYRIYNNAGSIRILEDVAGYFAPGVLDR